VLTLLDAARRVGVTKGAVLKAIRRGKLSATKDKQGQWRIDPAELTRAYNLGAPPAPQAADTGAPEVRERLARAEAMVEVLERQVADIQRRLDDAERERRELAGQGPGADRGPSRRRGLVEKALAKLITTARGAGNRPPRSQRHHTPLGLRTAHAVVRKHAELMNRPE
jgi:excisionase family DNA binding protein